MNKNAIIFGDARNMINEAKRRNIKLTRDPNYNSAYSPFDFKTKKVTLRSKLRPTININRDEVKTYGNSAREIFAHEMGHAVNFAKKKKSALIKGFGNNESVLKAERIANNNALNFIHDKKSRASYKLNVPAAYSSYTSDALEEGTSPIGRLKQKVLGIQPKIKNSLISHLKKKPWVR